MSQELSHYLSHSNDYQANKNSNIFLCCGGGFFVGEKEVRAAVGLEIVLSGILIITEYPMHPSRSLLCRVWVPYLT